MSLARPVNGPRRPVLHLDLPAARADGSCHARFMYVRPDAGPSGGATVRLSAAEVRALFNILGLAAAGGTLTEKPERDMAGRLQAELETALGG